MTMSKIKIPEIYPAEYLIEEDEMSENGVQYQLVSYLVQILLWYYRQENWYVIGNLMLIHPAIENSRHSITPDLSVFKGIEISQQRRKNMPSWRIDKNHPAPPVVLEIGSKETWDNDIKLGERQKPRIYGRIGVKEYFAYDPYEERLWEEERLRGWKYEEEGQPQGLVANERGWLWSEELDSWLGADGDYLRLYDREGTLRLTKAEAQDEAKQVESQARQMAETKARQETEARKKAEEKARKEAQSRIAEAKARKAAEARIAELEELLRRQGGKDN